MDRALIRRATLDDRDSLVRLRAALWPDGTPAEHEGEVNAILTGHPNSTLPLVILVAECDSRLVGFAEVGLRSHADGCDPSKPCGFLEGWYVVPAMSGQGIGSALVKEAEEWVRQQGCSEFASDTWLDNESAQRAHEALGFEVVDRCVNYRKTIEGDVSPGQPEASELYGVDLAGIHAAHYGALARAAATELVRRLHRQGFTSGTVVDLGAGSGILSRCVLDAGFDVVGVEISPAMLQLARASAPGARFVQESLWRFEVPSCVGVAAVGEVLNYATESDVPEVSTLIERVESIAGALAPGGTLLLDVSGPGRSGPSGTRSTSWEKDQSILWFSEVEATESMRLTRDIQTLVPVGRLYRRSHERHTLVLYDPVDVYTGLERAGFRVERLDRYEEMAFLPGWNGFAATTPSPGPHEVPSAVLPAQ